MRTVSMQQMQRHRELLTDAHKADGTGAGEDRCRICSLQIAGLAVAAAGKVLGEAQITVRITSYCMNQFLAKAGGVNDTNS